MTVEDALRTLAAEYAAAVDRLDAPALCSLFTDDGVLVVQGPEPWVMQGHDELATLISGVEGFAKTFHFVGQATYRVAKDAVTTSGEVACIAHHLVVTGSEARDLVWMIRYHDDYRCVAGRWLFARREIEMLWSEERPADPPPLAGPRRDLGVPASVLLGEVREH